MKNEKLVEQFQSWITAQGRSENTVKTYVGVIEKFFNWMTQQDKPLDAISKADVQDYMDYLEAENRSGSTIDKVFATIRVYAGFINRPEIVDQVRRKEKDQHIYQTVPESLQEQEIQHLLDQVKLDGDLRNIAIVYTLLYTGMRISELCALNRSDLHFHDQKGTIRIKSGHAPRAVPLTEEVTFHLQQLLNIHPNDTEALFVSNANNRLTVRAIQYMLKKYDVNPHKLRHTFCQELIKQGLDIAVVAKLAGHDDLNVTRRYTRAIHDGDRAAN